MRRRTRGVMIYDAAMEWRASRDQKTLSELTVIIDRFLQEDRAAGRRSHNRKSSYWLK